MVPVTVWDMYFAGLVSIAMHPGYLRPGTARLSLEDCAELADEMVELREVHLCHGQQQPPQ